MFAMIFRKFYDDKTSFFILTKRSSGFSLAKDKKIALRVLNEMKEELHESQKTILQEMRKNPRITLGEISVKMGLNEVTVIRHVRILKLKGYLRRLGPRYKSVDRRWGVLK